MAFPEPNEEDITEFEIVVDELILEASARRWDTAPMDRDLVIRAALGLGSPQFQTR